MSGLKSTHNLYQEIFDLDLLEKEEKDNLLIHFNNNPHKISEVKSVLDLYKDKNDKLEYLRKFLEINYEEEQERNVKKIQLYPTPSSFALVGNLVDYQISDQEFLIHRPVNCISTPVILYHPVFRTFLDVYHDKYKVMKKKHYQWTIDLIRDMSQIYEYKERRQDVFHKRLSELFGQEVQIIKLADDSSNDGVLITNVQSKNALLLLIEIKNEIGTGKCDPTTQAAISYAKFYTQVQNDRMLKCSNWPCLLLCLAGPWVCILGAVYVEKPLVDPLTHLIPLIPLNNLDHWEEIARLFGALRIGVKELRTFYISISNSMLPNPNRFFPFTDHYYTKKKRVEFTYEKKLVSDSRKLLWKARIKGGQEIVVKFTSSYCYKAHELCSKIGKAPNLLFIGEKTNGFHMVVMDYIEAKPLCNCEFERDDYAKIIKDIEEAVKELHHNKFVFGDLRETNILARKLEGQYCGMLIDFDWAGIEGTGRYPSFMNHEGIAWPQGAEDGMKLRQKHDIYWLNILRRDYLGEKMEID